MRSGARRSVHGSSPASRRQCRLSIDNPSAMNANASPPEVAVERPAGISGLATRCGSFRAVTRLGPRCCSPGWCSGRGPLARASNVGGEALGARAAGTVEHMMNSGARSGSRFRGRRLPRRPLSCWHRPRRASNRSGPVRPKRALNRPGAAAPQNLERSRDWPRSAPSRSSIIAARDPLAETDRPRSSRFPLAALS